MVDALIAGIDFRLSTQVRSMANPLRAAVMLWARAMDSMLRESPNATLKPRNIECTAPRQSKWNDGQHLLRFRSIGLSTFNIRKRAWYML